MNTTRTSHKPLPDQATLQRFYTYDVKTGDLLHNVTFGKRVKGAKVGTLCDNGMLRMQHDGVTYYVHKVVWMLFYGKDPGSRRVFHIDRDRTNNRISNLELK